ncbi:unnamed protein product, partial [Musa hybrid cultivar]
METINRRIQHEIPDTVGSKIDGSSDEKSQIRKIPAQTQIFHSLGGMRMNDGQEEICGASRLNLAPFFPGDKNGKADQRSSAVDIETSSERVLSDTFFSGSLSQLESKCMKRTWSFLLKGRRCVQGLNERVEHVQERKSEEKNGVVVTETLLGGKKGMKKQAYVLFTGNSHFLMHAILAQNSFNEVTRVEQREQPRDKMGGCLGNPVLMKMNHSSLRY